MKTLKEIVKDNTVHINKYRAGFLYYTVTVDEEVYIFPVPTDEAGEATFKKSDKAITFMRYIRKAMKDGSFVKLEE